MPVLLFPLMGPLQGWTLSAPHRDRTAQIIPTKAGVTGLLAACLGRRRDADLRDLSALAFHVRVDRAGVKVRDYQTAQRPLRANEAPMDGKVIARREFLSDAAFLGALEGSDAQRPLLTRIHAAFERPVFVPYLGRRDCLPSLPLHQGTGVLDQPVLAAFASHPPLVTGAGPRFRVFLESRDGVLLIRDQPGRRAAPLEREVHRAWYDRAVQPAWVTIPPGGEMPK